MGEKASSRKLEGHRHRMTSDWHSLNDGRGKATDTRSETDTHRWVEHLHFGFLATLGAATVEAKRTIASDLSDKKKFKFGSNWKCLASETAFCKGKKAWPIFNSAKQTLKTEIYNNSTHERKLSQIIYNHQTYPNLKHDQKVQRIQRLKTTLNHEEGPKI